MKTIKLFILLIPILSYSQKKTEQTFIGYEKICWQKVGKDSCVNYLSEIPNQKWYHENILKIRNDSVFLDKNPISKIDKKTIFSASDGGFYYYSGIIKRTKSEVKIELTELYCDYCAEEVSDNSKPIKKRKLIGKITKKGIQINGIYYTEVKSRKEKLISEYPYGL